MTAVRTPPVQRDSDPPVTPSSHHRDSSAPPKWEVNKVLDTVKDAFEQNDLLRESVDELSGNLQRERRRADELEDKLTRWQRESRADDDVRDRALEQARRDIRELANQVEILTRPKTVATADTTAASTTATMINAVRKKDQLWEAARWVAIVIVFVLTMLGVKLPDTKPNVSVPDTQPRTANPNNPAGIP